MDSIPKVVVVGEGPVGTLSALYAARRGYDTELYELRDDPNHGDPSLRPDFAVIPLALSERGINAIAGAEVPGLLDSILANSRDIFTRMLHTKDKSGNPELIPTPYGPRGELQVPPYIAARKDHKYCLLALEKEPTAKLFFNYKMTHLDFEGKVTTFEAVQWKDKSRVSEHELADNVIGRKPTPVAKPAEDFEGIENLPISVDQGTREVPYQFLIGADGTYSSVRQSLMRKLEVDFSQVYCNALWCDLILPADSKGNYRMDSQCLHVWPADDNIVMAQPDFNGSFRAGMVCDTETVRYHEEHPEKFTTWFKNQFPGIFVKHQKIPLKSIKVNKLGYEDSVPLLGDSLHTMTPFHAMGMITGLEDVWVFFKQFRDLAAALAATEKWLPPLCPAGTIAAYTTHRLPDVHSMVDIAHNHYFELRHGVRSPTKRARATFDHFLSRWAPFLDWTTLYARIQFGNDRFSDVVRKQKSQDKAVTIAAALLASFTVAGIGVVCAVAKTHLRKL